MSTPEIVKPSATDIVLQKAREAKELLTTQQMAFIEKVADLDWKHLPPPVMAQILTKIPRRGKGDEIWYLTLEQALVYALRCYELDLSPLSSDVFFMKETWQTGVTTSGKMLRARKAGLNLGPPRFERKERPHPTVKNKIDIGFECRITVNAAQDVSYLAWVSEWEVTYSPVWKAKPEHMCMVRAMEKAISFASGTGVSDMPDEREIEAPDAAPVLEVEKSEQKAFEYREKK